MPHSDPAAEISYQHRPLGRMTVDYAISAKYDLHVHCAKCRVVRPVDLLSLALAGRGGQAIADIKFVCSKPECRARGTPFVDGWEDGGRTSYSCVHGG